MTAPLLNAAGAPPPALSTTGAPLEETLASVLSHVGVRVKLAANPTTPESLLAVLARDPVMTVRGAVAFNPNASAGADRRLASDADERVRLLLARKIVGQAPQQTRGADGSIPRRTYEILATLVQDEAVRIRRLLSEELARLPNSPHALIIALARDGVISVSEPVLRLSPMLSSSDLLALLDAPPHAAAAGAIASRLNLPEIVSDAIAASADDDAICTLLGNASAAIRESTLESLIGRAGGRRAWQEKLVHRPALPDHAARALSEIVASHLLETLASRDDLAPELLIELRERLASRLLHPATMGSTGPSEDDILMADARRLNAEGRLDETTLQDAARRGQPRRAAALLAIAANVPMKVIDHAVALRSAKALVSLVWKAGFTMAVAPAMQSLLGQLGPLEILEPGAGGAFPLGDDELKWQLDFLGVAAR